MVQEPQRDRDGRPRIAVSYARTAASHPPRFSAHLGELAARAAAGVEAAGGHAIVVDAASGQVFSAEDFDGVLILGGGDVDPARYGGDTAEPTVHGVDTQADETEIDLVVGAHELGKPVFGICRGLQLINVAHGGTLYQDISTQKPGALVHRDADAYDLNFHQVDILPDTRLARLLGSGRHKINSVHHQGVKDLAPGFVVEAVSPTDGVVEAIRHTGGPWIAAVQWHPEFHRPELGVIDDTPLLRDFLAAARAARGTA
jgi:putative glutamine amidotransferase